jgi:SAM-dependent methyltransferase
MLSTLKEWKKKYLDPSILNLTIALNKSHFCPCCGQHCIKFFDWSLYSKWTGSYTDVHYKKILCPNPNCRSQPRHRALFLYLQKHANFKQNNLKVLHFGPNPSLRKHFSLQPNLEYITADLYDSSVDIKIDITKIPYPENTFDIIFCSHVLELIPDDRAAMSELFRVLKPGGWALVAVPISENQKTFEDPNIIFPEERLRYFWQEDHVRLYGHDYKNRLQEVGFTVRAVTVKELLKDLTPKQREKYGLHDRELLHFVTKNI